jgi:cytochrome c-type biogenesis protein
MVQIFFAFLAGVLTIAAPCILPILPVVLGVSIGNTSRTRPLFIVAGFVTVFSIAAVLLSYLSRSIGLDTNFLRTIGVIILGIFGLLMLWPAVLDPIMARVAAIFARAGTIAGPGKGNWKGFVLGMTLGIVWTPCAGPVLGSILTLISLQREVTVAAILLLAYSLGAGVPMLVIAYSGQYLTTKVESLARYSVRLQRFFGVIVILLAIAIYFNYDVTIYSWFLKYCPSFSPKL